ANAAAGGDRVPSCPRPAGSAVLADACGGGLDEAAGADHRAGVRVGLGGGGAGGGAAAAAAGGAAARGEGGDAAVGGDIGAVGRVAGPAGVGGVRFDVGGDGEVGEFEDVLVAVADLEILLDAQGGQRGLAGVVAAARDLTQDRVDPGARRCV